MPEFMVLVQENEAEERKLTPAETAALVEGHAAFERTLRAVGAYVDGERMRPSAEGRRVSNRDGKVRVDIGPFADKPLGGYYLVKADDLDAALALTEKCPIPSGTELEVRPIMGGNLKPGKSSQQGRVFAFGVLGSAANEQGWADVMDRVQACSNFDFPAERSDRMFGGVRLHAPSRGRRVVASGNQRTVFDGPFLESKEVIGGLFFMRMTTIDEAAHWATTTEFVKHGAVEIRELWRS